MNPKITVVPLGPAGPELMTLQAVDALKSASRIVLRTERHPAAAWLREQGLEYTSLDVFYDRYDDFDAMHQAMAEHLWSEARKGEICFGVMDAGRDGAVQALKEKIPARGKLRVLPGVSAVSLCESSLPANRNVNAGFRVFTATDFLTAAPDPSVSLWITELDSPLMAGEVKLRLTDQYGEETEIFFFPPSEKEPRPCRRIPLYQLDGQKKYDHTAAAMIPGSGFMERDRFSCGDLEAIVSRLRAPDGCPWDRIQTHASLTPYMIEEAWEAVSAVEEDDPEHLADELGDVLFQVFIHASIGQSFGEFTLTDVLTGICRKMLKRHPHVFRRSNGETADEIAFGWEKIKRAETGSRTLGESLDEVSPALPSLKYSIKTYRKLAQLPELRRDPDTIAAEIAELASSLTENGKLSEENMASLLMKCTELCFRTDRDAEILLHRAVDRMKKRVQAAEKMLIKEGKSPESLTNKELCVYLQSVGRETE